MVPDTEELISQDVLDTLSVGQLQALQLRVVQQHEKILDPSAYHEFAQHSLSSGADWGTTWAVEDPDDVNTAHHDDAAEHSKGQHAGPTPVAPEDFYNTLPRMIDNMAKSRRLQDAIIANLTQVADQAYRHDRATVLGIPAGVNLQKTGKRWLADRFQIEARQASKFYNRAEFIAGGPTSIVGVAKAPLLPKLADAYNTGSIPSENVDRICQIAKQFYDFYQNVGLSKDKATEILQAMDPVLTDAAVGMKPQALAEESQKWLNQVAHIVDPDGPPPQDRGAKLKNSLNTRIVSGKLNLNIITDVVTVELIEALILAGLNYRANQDTFRQETNDEHESTEEPASQPTAGPTTASSTSDEPASSESGCQHDDPAAGGSTLFDGVDLGGPTPYDDQVTAQQRLALFKQRMDDAVNDPDTHVETEDGHTLSRDEMRKLDPRSRSEKAHDIFMTILKAQSKRSPGADGWPSINAHQLSCGPF